MTRPRALDLCCCAGGASQGLYDAGFDVVGVDVKYHKNYPFPVIICDALNIESVLNLSDFDYIWASPPCQKWSKATPKRCRDSHPDIIEPIRNILERSGALYTIENVSAAPIRPDVILEGLHFGLPLERRRIFETNFDTSALQVGPKSRPAARPIDGSSCRPNSGPSCQAQNGPIPGAQVGLPKAISVTGGGGPDKGTLDEWKAAMGIDWMTRRELVEAVPPAYSEAIGRCALSHIMRAAA